MYDGRPVIESLALPLREEKAAPAHELLRMIGEALPFVRHKS